MAKNKNIQFPAVHMGKEIAKRMDEKRLKRPDLAKLMGTSYSNVYTMLNRRIVDIKLLQRVSQALDYNFFFFYTPEVHTPPENVKKEERKSERYKNKAKRLETEVEELKQALKEKQKDYEHQKELTKVLKQSLEALRPREQATPKAPPPEAKEED